MNRREDLAYLSNIFCVSFVKMYHN